MKGYDKVRPNSIARTYQLTPELVARLSATAQAHRVSINDLVGYLLDRALDQVETGALVIRTCEGSLRRIVHG